ncbi:helix-turn-helix transcriptional regulator [Macrococcus carouselicus]|uniref:XRE family transcriptional regulator n=1 Tax=Macrococcus carouselicus TaxID=69969 RepID=A0A9Q8FPT9_9STAP|nr:helix-turn-helix transcriptional regulator [Macrococcus carouselicus]TDM04610.1 XRE family transcriptional regulator [Macrococcus carouselicus]
MNNEEMMAAIKYHRENLGFSSTEVATAIGYDVSKYSRLENGHQYITLVEAVKIAHLFGMKVDELIRIPSKKNR